MSQSRKCKISSSAEHFLSNGDNGPRHDLSMARTAKDLQSRSTHPNECRRKKSNKKIPKSLRYDLEAALVGLCDVWFENIKPHLVRNNIKLHVHNTEAAADAAASACGDLETPAMPPCAHLDPGAATDLLRQEDACYVGFCATQPIASEAQCFRPQVSICQNQSSHGRPLKTHQNNEILLKNKCKHQPRRVSRTCQTNAILRAPMTEPTFSFKDRHIRNLFKSVFKKVPVCPPTTPLSALPKSKQITNMASQTVPQMYCTFLDNLCSLNRLRATTPLSHNKTQQRVRNQPNLFQNDLIDIIGKRNDEILRDISKSQQKVGYPSLVNLVSPRDRQKTGAPKKNPPWR
ncbi:unnamed protein product [Arctia plantaginis]|uniref:Uncharacterized protein n=1 Tax=Arctia plantaginis TaxID=874455 RepID=A0A8S1A3I9_ARCPL|nr:unnamed protein product [Arctia plantaginis]